MPAPDFSIHDESGTLRSLSQFAGKTVVLWFGTVAEDSKEMASGLRRLSAALAHNGVEVLGVAAAAPAEARSFRQAEALPFPVLCDTERILGMAYGAWAPDGTEPRCCLTVVVDSEGNVAQVLDAAGGWAGVLAELAGLA